jgi:hypothetical protein
MKSTIVALAAIVAATTVATEFAFVAYSRVQVNAAEVEIKLLSAKVEIMKSLPAIKPAAPAPTHPGGANPSWL